MSLPSYRCSTAQIKTTLSQIKKKIYLEVMRTPREYRIKDGSGPVVKAGTKLEACNIYHAKGYHVTCSQLVLLRGKKKATHR
jgi:hypothetical protein